MIRHLLLVIACAGCFEEATLAPQPDASENPPPPPMDADTGSDTGTPLPAGVTMLAPGHFLGLASHVANGRLYALEYPDATITAHPTRIVSIDATTGAVATFHDLPAGSSPTNLQATDTSLFWLDQSASSTVLYRKTFASQLTTPPTVVAGPNLPQGESLDTYALYPGANKIYVLLTKGATYRLGSVPDSAVAQTPMPFTSLVTGTIPAGATSVSFTGYSSTIAHLGTIVYAGARATNGTLNVGIVLKMDTQAHTSTMVSTLADTFMSSFWATGVRVHWLAEKSGAVTMFTGDPISMQNTGAVATLPNGTYSLINKDSSWFATSLPGTATDLVSVTPGAVASPPTGTTAMVASIPDCLGQTSQDCVSKISLLAADGTSVYWSTEGAVYKYTP